MDLSSLGFGGLVVLVVVGVAALYVWWTTWSAIRRTADAVERIESTLARAVDARAAAPQGASSKPPRTCQLCKTVNEPSATRCGKCSAELWG